MEKILFVCTSMPTKLGAVRRLYNNMLFFSKDYEIHFARIKLDEAKTKAGMEVPKWIKFVEIKPGDSLPDIEMIDLVPPTWNEYHGARGAGNKLQDYIDRNGIDIVFCNSITLAFALRDLKAKVKIADLVDSVLNYYKTKDAAGSTPFTKAMFFAQKVLYRRLERIIDEKFDIVLFCSDIDRKESIISKGKICLLDVIYIPDLGKKEVEQKNFNDREIDVVLMGRWEHPPNRDGLTRILTRLGEVKGKVRIIGTNLDPSLKLPDNVKAIGFVEDIEETLSNSKVCLVPVWYGAGLQNKIFDALRCGCVIVSTSYAKEQNEANDFKSSNIIYSDNVIEAANMALAAYNNKTSAKMYDSYEEWREISRKNKIEYTIALRCLIDNKKLLTRP